MSAACPVQAHMHLRMVNLPPGCLLMYRTLRKQMGIGRYEANLLLAGMLLVTGHLKKEDLSPCRG